MITGLAKLGTAAAMTAAAVGYSAYKYLRSLQDPPIPSAPFRELPEGTYEACPDCDCSGDAWCLTCMDEGIVPHSCGVKP